MWNENNTFVLVAGVHIQEVPGPAIGSLTPLTGVQGSAVTINGTNFGASQGSSGNVKFGSVPAIITSWNDTSIVATVPAVPVGPTSVVVSAGGKDSPASSYTVTCPTAGPCVNYVSPPSAAPGLPVTLTGSSFGSAPGSVTFGVTAASAIPSWSATTITATVPNISAGPANIVVTAAGATSPPASFNVLCPAGSAPCIASLSAKTVADATAAGGILTITGTNFGDSPGAVTLGATAAPATSWTSTKITVTVPCGSGSGVAKRGRRLGGKSEELSGFV